MVSISVMALANFFDKSALAASQVLNGYDPSAFRDLLQRSPVEIVFDQQGVNTSEGQASLELTVRLLSRLYPEIIFTALDADDQDQVSELKQLALSINPDIGFEAKLPAVAIVIGKTRIDRSCPTFYIGSKGWKIGFSAVDPIGSADSLNPFAAGAAACFGAANIFRSIFGHQLNGAGIDNSFYLSLLDFEFLDQQRFGDEPFDPIPSIFIGEATLVGLGAIGNGVIWALSKLEAIQGDLHLVDPEIVDLSNLQRYILADQDSINQSKAAVMLPHLNQNELKLHMYHKNWASFLGERGYRKLELVLSAVDSAQDRIAIQAALPEKIINAWTQQGDLGVSRHFDFINDACLACVYPAKATSKSESLLIAESFGLVHEEINIRQLLYNNESLDHAWIEKIAAAKDVPVELLTPFTGQPVRNFYHTVFCGGVIIGQEKNQQVETPMAFQSALAGILLASEFIVGKGALRSGTMPTMTRIDLLKPIAAYLNDPLLKPSHDRCICQDDDFKTQYKKKYLEPF